MQCFEVLFLCCKNVWNILDFETTLNIYRSVKRTMANDDSPSSPSAVAFEIVWDDPVKPTLPARFRGKKQMDEDAQEERMRKMQDRQCRAQLNKEEQTAARLVRIHKRQDHCHLMAFKMEKLLAQDAKRRGVAGTEDIPPMTRREAGAMIRSVHRDFQSLGFDLDDQLRESAS